MVPFGFTGALHLLKESWPILFHQRKSGHWTGSQRADSYFVETNSQKSIDSLEDAQIVSSDGDSCRNTSSAGILKQRRQGLYSQIKCARAVACAPHFVVLFRGAVKTDRNSERVLAQKRQVLSI